MHLRRLAIIGTLGAVAVAGTAPLSPVAAYHFIDSGRYSGQVTAYQVQGSHYDNCGGLGYTCFTPWVLGRGPRVFRSPASTGRQTIGVVYQLLRWNGSAWVEQARREHVRALGSGYGSIDMPRIDFLATVAGHFQVRMVVGWASADGSRIFGRRAVSYDQTGDYVCNTRFPCSTGAGWVWLRSPGI